MVAYNVPHEQPPDPRAWLEQFPTPRRSTIANWFHYAVRNGAQTPHAVCSAVWQTMQQQLEWSTTPENREFLLHCLEVLRSDQAGALTYGQSVLNYEPLPYEAATTGQSRTDHGLPQAGDGGQGGHARATELFAGPGIPGSRPRPTGPQRAR